MECDICCDTYKIDVKEPKILSRCGHTICSVCVEAMRRLSGDDISCPHCRVLSSVNDVRTNFAVLGFLNKATSEKSSTQRPFCMTHKDVQVNVYCVPCGQFICHECFETVSSSHSTHARVTYTDGIEMIKTELTRIQGECANVAADNEKILNAFIASANDLTRLNDSCVNHYDRVIEMFKHQLIEVQNILRQRSVDLQGQSAVVVDRLNTVKAIEQFVGRIRPDITSHLVEYMTSRTELQKSLSLMTSEFATLGEHLDRVNISDTHVKPQVSNPPIPHISFNFPQAYSIYSIQRESVDVSNDSVRVKRRTLHRKTSNDELNG